MKIKKIPFSQLKFHFLLLSLLLFICTAPVFPVSDSTGTEPRPTVTPGILDLTSYDFDQLPPRVLKENWDFYWQQFLNPQTTVSYPQPDAQVPLAEGIWQNVKVGSGALPNSGFATYRLRILFKKDEKGLALKIPEFFSACRIWVNGAMLFEAGSLAKSPQDEHSFYKTGIIHFIPLTGENTILVEVSNFHERRGGSNQNLVIGRDENTAGLYQRSLALDLTLAGIMLAMGFYHLCLFLIRKRDASPFWFGLFCLIIAVRTLLYGNRFLFHLFPGLPWEFFNVADHLTFYLGFPIFAEYIRIIFIKEISTRIIRIYQGLGIVFSLFLFFPAAVFNSTVIGYEIISAATGGYVLFIIGRALYRHREGSLVSVIGIFLFILLGMNEFLFNIGAVHTFNTLSLGLLAFLMSQSILLAMRFSQAYEVSERLSQDLMDTNKALRKFIPQEFFNLLQKSHVNDIRLGDQVEKKMSIMFADIRSFTSMAEQMTSSQTFNFLNSYFGRIGAIVRKYGGFIDKYIGDGFMALFPDRPDAALQAAVELQKVVSEYNQHRMSVGYKPIEVGSGLNFGHLVLGTIGEEDRMETTVIADSVNLSSRLEGLTKFYGKGTIVTLDFMDNLEKPEDFHWRYLGRIRVLGRQESVEAIHIYDGLPDGEWQLYHRLKDSFEEALSLYRNGSMAEALVAFQKIAEIHPEDPATQTYLTRIHLLLKTGLSDDWDGIESIISK